MAEASLTQAEVPFWKVASYIIVVLHGTPVVGGSVVKDKLMKGENNIITRLIWKIPNFNAQILQNLLWLL